MTSWDKLKIPERGCHCFLYDNHEYEARLKSSEGMAGSQKDPQKSLQMDQTVTIPWHDSNVISLLMNSVRSGVSQSTPTFPTNQDCHRLVTKKFLLQRFCLQHQLSQTFNVHIAR